uniref:NADH dehydrogenase [ubiquinone] iron-sulfur protein 6, mitochondrial n=1 Tax=Amphilophus citrinellus TaxID=61819 RepID=A0A3Q0S869_AMPCI
MAAAVGRALSFSTKLLVSPLRLTAVSAHRYSAEVSGTGEPITHTGQVNVLCIVCVKVNKNFAIKLVAEEPVTDIEARVVSCDGGGGALGHPKVYINLDKDTKVGTCGYCGLQFKQKHHH